ncbi:hypothetical protein NIES2101_18945 [Calothrix sp. HK-06]|nr:hypothetical protein NIES2101_18945 [Calothrix sp. HK-06]
MAAAFHTNYQGNITTDQIDVFQDAITNFKFLRHIPNKEEFVFSVGIISEASLPALLKDTCISLIKNPQTSERIKV